jgi:cell division protein ZapB
MANSALQILESKIDDLIALCGDLDRENRRLMAENSGWQRERQELIEKNELASSKVEAMIDRLRSVE